MAYFCPDSDANVIARVLCLTMTQNSPDVDLKWSRPKGCTVDRADSLGFCSSLSRVMRLPWPSRNSMGPRSESYSDRVMMARRRRELRTSTERFPRDRSSMLHERSQSWSPSLCWGESGCEHEATARSEARQESRL